MKYKDYKRLAKISLLSRKKQTRSTVRGICIGMLFILPIIFLGLSLYAGINAELNKNPNQLYTSFKHFNISNNKDSVMQSSDDYSYTPAAIGSQLAKDAISNLESYLSYDIYESKTFNYQDIGDDKLYLKYSIDGSEEVLFDNSTDEYGNFPDFNLAVVDNTISQANSILSNYMIDDYNGGYTDTGKGQVILSTELLNHLGLEPSDVYGKEFTLKYLDYAVLWNGSTILDDDKDPSNDLVFNSYYNESKYLFKSYKVIGVTSYEGSTSGRSSTDIFTNAFIVMKSSLVGTEGQTLVPSYKEIYWNGYETTTEDNGSKYQLLTYTQSQEVIDSLEGEYIYPGGYNFTSVDQDGEDYHYVFVFSGDYNKLNQDVTMLYNKFSYLNGEDGYTLLNSSTLYTMSKMLFLVFNVLMIIQGATGGIILFSSLVNIFNTIMHSVDQRKNYLGVMRAIGAEDSTIPKLYLIEVLTVFKRAFIAILIIGGPICIGLLFGLNFGLSAANQGLGTTIAISWTYIPISFLIVVAVMLIFGFAFGVGCSKSQSEKPITEVLGG